MRKIAVQNGWAVREPEAPVIGHDQVGTEQASVGGYQFLRLQLCQAQC